MIMKKTAILFVVAALCIIGCDCPDCGPSIFSVNATQFLVDGDSEATQSSTPGQIVLTSSYAWTATNLSSEYVDFSVTEGEGGVFHFPVRLRQAFFDAFHSDPFQFVIDGIGCQAGQLRFTSSQGDIIDITIYLADVAILVFDANGSTDAPPAPMIIFKGVEVVIPYNTTGMARSAKTFVGWGTKADGSGDFYNTTNNKGTFYETTNTLYALWSGDGSAADSPIHIYNHMTLNNVRTTLSDGLYYLVVADFDANYDEENGILYPSWEPLGDEYASGKVFRGFFEGQGHTINYSITAPPSQPAAKFCGLFGLVYDASIQNLKVVGEIDVAVTDNNAVWAGGLVGYSEGSTLSQIATEVNINVVVTGAGTGSISVGGLVAAGTGGSVSNVYTTGDITVVGNSQVNVGGVLGMNTTALSYAYATGAIDATGTSPLSGVGGLVGFCNPVPQSIINSVALNKELSTSVGYLGRIHGSTNLVSADNYANSGMQLLPAPFDYTDVDKHGYGITGTNWSSSAWWQNTTSGSGPGWDPNIWNFDNISATSYPRLRWE